MDDLSPAVERRIEAFWTSDDDRRRVREALASYGRDRHEQEPERVRLAVLKLSGSDVETAIEMAAAAKGDFRDVLMWAEYPEESRAPLELRLDRSREADAVLGEIRRRDRQQYEEWLKRTEP